MVKSLKLIQKEQNIKKKEKKRLKEEKRKEVDTESAETENPVNA